MLFQLAWTHSPEARDKTIKQFMETGTGGAGDRAGAPNHRKRRVNLSIP